MVWVCGVFDCALACVMCVYAGVWWWCTVVLLIVCVCDRVCGCVCVCVLFDCLIA